jgi:hypothetical protein
MVDTISRGLATSLRFLASVLAKLLFTLPVCWVLSMTGSGLGTCYERTLAAKACAKAVWLSQLQFLLPSIGGDDDGPFLFLFFSVAFAAAILAISWEVMSRVLILRRARMGRE